MIKNIGIASALGGLLGFALIWWAEPSNAGGIGWLILVPTLICAVLGGIVSLLFGKKKEPDDKKHDNGTPKDGGQDDTG
jgi:predicted phage tail protein